MIAIGYPVAKMVDAAVMTTAGHNSIKHSIKTILLKSQANQWRITDLLVLT